MNRKYPRFFPFALVLLLASVARADETLPQLVKRVKPAVVAIATYDANGEALMTGSGFFLKPGQVVTNLHVVRGAARAEIKTLDGKGKVFPVTGAIAVDEEGDLALLNVEMPLERARSSELAPELPDEGETIFVIGNPLKLEGRSATASFPRCAKSQTAIASFKSRRQSHTATAAARFSICAARCWAW